MFNLSNEPFINCKGSLRQPLPTDEQLEATKRERQEKQELRKQKAEELTRQFQDIPGARSATIDDFVDNTFWVVVRMKGKGDRQGFLPEGDSLQRRRTVVCRIARAIRTLIQECPHAADFSNVCSPESSWGVWKARKPREFRGYKQDSFKVVIYIN